MPVVGPTLPPHLSNKRKASDSPPPPPSKRSRSSSPSAGPALKRGPIGPAPPPADLATRPTTNANGDSESSSSSDDDDNFGPAPPPPPGSHSHTLETQRQQTLAAAISAQSALNSANAQKPQREEWMLVPPTDSDWTSKVDPTKLRNRKFQSGKGAKAPPSSASAAAGGGGSGIGTTWTETPEQKRQRLEDEMLGVVKPAQLADSSSHDARAAGGGSGGDAGRAWRRREEEETREAERRIREYNEQHRGASLMEERGKRVQREEEDDPSKRAWDREKDMKLGGVVGEKQKRELLREARGMGDRFAKGSYL